MEYLYLDNIHGFQDEVIPICDVNFLVGENSSGKTSVLRILNLLQMQQFWFRGTFNYGGVELGRFGDIISVNSSDRDSFAIGWAEVQDKGSESFLVCLEFSKGEESPRLETFLYLSERGNILFKINDNTIWSVDEAYDVGAVTKRAVTSILSGWRSTTDRFSEGYNIIEYPEQFTRRSTLPFLSFYLENKEVAHTTPDWYYPAEMFAPSYHEDFAWIGPIRTSPQRTYDRFQLEFSPEGEHTPYLLRKIFQGGDGAENFASALQGFGETSGLFQGVDIKEYGDSGRGPFTIEVELQKSSLELSRVGYGVGQSLPIVVELLVRQEGARYAMQQPEVHLHPKAQAALGQLIHKAWIVEGKTFLVETHSDYMIDRFRVLMKNEDDNSDRDSQVLFFERDKGLNNVCEIPIRSDGKLSDKQPPQYREFFVEESLEVVKV